MFNFFPVHVLVFISFFSGVLSVGQSQQTYGNLRVSTKCSLESCTRLLIAHMQPCTTIYTEVDTVILPLINCNCEWVSSHPLTKFTTRETACEVSWRLHVLDPGTNWSCATILQCISSLSLILEDCIITLYGVRMLILQIFSMRVAQRTRVLSSNLQSRSGCISSFKLDTCVLPQTRYVWLRFSCCLLIFPGAWICLDLVFQWWVLRVLLHMEELCALDSCWNALVLAALCLDEVYLLNSCPKTWYWSFAIWCELNISCVQVLTERFMPLDEILILSCLPGLVFQAQKEGVSLAS